MQLKRLTLYTSVPRIDTDFRTGMYALEPAHDNAIGPGVNLQMLPGRIAVELGTKTETKTAG